MQFFGISFALPFLLAPLASGEHREETQLTFFDSTVSTNTLHLIDGELRYDNVGIFDSKPFDMRVKLIDETADAPTYTSIASSWAARDDGKTRDSTLNGKKLSPKYGNINLQYKDGEPNSGTGNFEFCFFDHGTEDKVTLADFHFTIWDLDEHSKDKYNNNGDSTNGIGIKEKFTFDASQVESYALFPNWDESTVKPICEDNTAITCQDGPCTSITNPAGTCINIKTVFRSSATDEKGDNPVDPNSITSVMRERAINLHFQDKSCFSLQYSLYCPLEHPHDAINHYVGRNLNHADTHCRIPEKNSGYSGGNFMFAGISDALFRDVTSHDEPIEAPQPEIEVSCEDLPQEETRLTFYDSTVSTNTLHLIGGELRYDNVGIFNSEQFDMTVKLIDETADAPTYTSIASSWANRQDKTRDSTLNGKKLSPKYGNINLQYKDGEPNSGTGNFEFCFIDHVTKNKVTLADFHFTIWDLDERSRDRYNNNGDSKNGVGIKEKFTFDASQVKSYTLFPNWEESKVKPICEDNTAITCQIGQCTTITNPAGTCEDHINTVFRSSSIQRPDDSPVDPEIITEFMRKRAINLHFENTSCFTLQYSLYCPLEHPHDAIDHYVGRNLNDVDTHCRIPENKMGYAGGNFLFAGISEAVFSDPTCDEPTEPPTEAPEPPYDGKCSADSSGSDNLFGLMKMCLRTSLGYTNAATNIFQEVNFIETLIKIRYDLTAGFCVDTFAVEPKERVEYTGSKSYGLDAWLCDPDVQEYDETLDRTLPKKIVSYDTDATNTDGDTFKQGSLINVCVASDQATHDDGVVIKALTDFKWLRNEPVVVEQEAIANSAASLNFLTSYNPTECSGKEWCTFASVLFADFYSSPGSVVGNGNADLEFVTTRRKLRGVEEEGRQLQDADADAPSPFDLSVSVSGIDDGPGAIRTAGGTSFGLSSLASAVALVVAALLA